MSFPNLRTTAQPGSTCERITAQQLFTCIRIGTLGLAVGCGHSGSSEPAAGNVSADDQQVSQQSSERIPAEDNNRSNESNQQGTNQMKVLTVSKRVGGIETLIGKITFNGTNAPQLSIEAEGPDGEQLQSDWNELVAEESIPLEMREVKEVNGETISELKAVLVAPGDEDYDGAVWSYLESNYGYLVDVDY